MEYFWLLIVNSVSGSLPFQFLTTLFLGNQWSYSKNLGKSLMYTGYFWLLTVQIQFGVIRFISDFLRPYISETDSRRAKRTKIWSLGYQVFSVIAHVWLLSVQVQFGVVRFISDFRASLYLETSGQWWAKRDQNCTLRVKSLIAPAEYLSFNCLGAVWDHSSAFPVFDDLVSTFDLNIQGSMYC